MADAPQRIAVRASSTLLMQQILTLGRDSNFIAIIAGSWQIESGGLSRCALDQKCSRVC
jgi:hypothetical protein